MLSESKQETMTNNSVEPSKKLPTQAAATLRVKFSKTGMLRFISHLDLLRTMQSALVRARVPVWYTEGFNPHPKLVFALPLSLGAESVCELLDIKITRRVGIDQTFAALEKAFPPDLRPLEVYYAEEKFPAICWARYELTPEEGASPDLSILDKPEIIVMKRTKSGEKETDIKPKIRDWSLSDSGKLTLTLRAAVNDFLSPELVARTLGVDSARILRTEVLHEDGTTFR